MQHSISRSFHTITRSQTKLGKHVGINTFKSYKIT